MIACVAPPGVIKLSICLSSSSPPLRTAISITEYEQTIWELSLFGIISDQF